MQFDPVQEAAGCKSPEDKEIFFKGTIQKFIIGNSKHEIDAGVVIENPEIKGRNISGKINQISANKIDGKNLIGSDIDAIVIRGEILTGKIIPQLID